jgi:hypothetical protein
LVTHELGSAVRVHQARRGATLVPGDPLARRFQDARRRLAAVALGARGLAHGRLSPGQPRGEQQQQRQQTPHVQMIQDADGSTSKPTYRHYIPAAASPPGSRSRPRVSQTVRKPRRSPCDNPRVVQVACGTTSACQGRS